ncbi:MAG: hypothetical protein U0W24_07185 [Bacteroidales bacterium]
MKNLIEKSIENWIVQNSPTIAESMLKNIEDQEIPIELLVISSYLDKIRNKILSDLSCNHSIHDINISLSTNSYMIETTIYFDKDKYNTKFGNEHYSHFNVERIIEYFDNYLKTAINSRQSKTIESVAV